MVGLRYLLLYTALPRRSEIPSDAGHSLASKADRPRVHPGSNLCELGLELISRRLIQAKCCGEWQCSFVLTGIQVDIIALESNLSGKGQGKLVHAPRMGLIKLTYLLLRGIITIALRWEGV